MDGHQSGLAVTAIAAIAAKMADGGTRAVAAGGWGGGGMETAVRTGSSAAASAAGSHDAAVIPYVVAGGTLALLLGGLYALWSANGDPEQPARGASESDARTHSDDGACDAHEDGGKHEGSCDTPTPGLPHAPTGCDGTAVGAQSRHARATRTTHSAASVEPPEGLPHTAAAAATADGHDTPAGGVRCATDGMPFTAPSMDSIHADREGLALRVEHGEFAAAPASQQSESDAPHPEQQVPCQQHEPHRWQLNVHAHSPAHRDDENEEYDMGAAAGWVFLTPSTCSLPSAAPAPSVPCMRGLECACAGCGIAALGSDSDAAQ